MIADALPVSMHGRGFGFHRGSEKLGAALGPLVGALVYWLSGRQLRVVLLVSIIPGVAATLLTLRLRDDRPMPATGGRTKPVRLPKRFWVAAWPLWAASLVVVSESFVLLRSSAVGVGTSLLLVFVAANLIQAVVGPRIGSWTDRHSTAPRSPSG